MTLLKRYRNATEFGLFSVQVQSEVLAKIGLLQHIAVIKIQAGRKLL